MSTAQTPGGELSKGARWMISQIDSMQASYKESLKAAVTILQYQTTAKKLGLGRQDAPRDVSQRLEDAWAKYELTKRHVEWYMKQNAYYASSPNHPAIIMPTPQPPLLAEQSLQTPSSDMPKASPIPLSAASLLAYSGENVTQPHTAPNTTTQAGINSQTSLQQNVMDLNIPVNPFGDGSMDFTNTSTNNGSYDLSALGLGELTNLINSADDFFQSTTNTQNVGGDMAMFDQAVDASSQMAQGLTPNTQAATDNLMASLGNLTSTTQMNQLGIPSVPPPQGGMDNSTDVQALLASLSASAGAQTDFTGMGTSGLSTGNMFGQGSTGDGQQEFNFDFGTNNEGSAGDMDLSELVGLFNIPSEDPSRTASKAPTPVPPTQGQQGGQEQSSGSKASDQLAQTGRPSQQSQQNQQSRSTQNQQSQQQSQTETNVKPEQPQRPQQQQPASQQTQPPQIQQPSTQPQQPQASLEGQRQDENDTQKQSSQLSSTIPSNPFENNDQFDLSNFNMGNLGASNIPGLEGFSGTNASGNPGMNPFEQNNNAAGGMADGFDVTMGDEGGIDMDEFNFTDSGMPNVDGDEFESLFAEFK